MLKLTRKDRLAIVYGKPLGGGSAALIAKALSRVKASIVARVRHELLRAPFSTRAKEAFARAIKVQVKASSLSIISSHPALIHFLKGRKSRQMSWLVKSPAPIPIFTDSGELIFRSATPKSMADGKWVHPGKDRYDFVERVKQEAKAAVKKSMLKEMLNIAKGGK